MFLKLKPCFNQEYPEILLPETFFKELQCPCRLLSACISTVVYSLGRLQRQISLLTWEQPTVTTSFSTPVHKMMVYKSNNITITVKMKQIGIMLLLMVKGQQSVFKTPITQGYGC